MTSPFYSRTLFFNTPQPPPPPPPPVQVVNAISIFGNGKKVYLQFKGRMPTANWPLQSFSYFYLVIVFTAGQYTQFCRIKGCGGAGCPPPIIFERLKLPQQIIYRRKENLSESPNHFKYRKKYFDFAIL